MKTYTRATILFLVLATLIGSGMAQQSGPVSFTNLVAIGDSLTAGFQSGVLRAEGQQNSYAALIARRAGTYLFLPLVTDPGFGNEVTLVNGVPVQGPATGGAPGDPRVFPLIVPQNLAVPGQDVAEALTVRPDLPINSLEDVLLGIPILLLPGVPPLSQIELGVGLQPTVTLFWLGANDVLGAALAGDASLATPLPVFQQAYTTAVGALLTLTSTRLVVANVPDVTVIAYLTPAEEIAAQAGAPLAAIGPLLGIAAGDSVTAPGIPLVQAILTGQMAGPLPDSVVLTAAETEQLRVLVAQMNGYINALAAQLGFAVVDVNGILNEIDQNGVQVGGRTLTTDFLGGIFSLDGFHPTNTGQALVANAFIERMNASLGTSIPMVNVAAIAAADPLVPAVGGASAAKRIMSVTPEVHENLMAIFKPSASRLPGDDDKGEATEERHEANWFLQRMDQYLANFRHVNIMEGPVWGGLTISVEEACHQPTVGDQLLERPGR